MHFEVWGAVAKVRAVATPVPFLQLVWLVLPCIWHILRGREVALVVSRVEALLFIDRLCLDEIVGWRRLLFVGVRCFAAGAQHF
uniref:Uncharacterized protein n=1 Tax=Ixodes ricinus TaxID=34613 RepID=A0A6B0UEM8_IXORI